MQFSDQQLLHQYAEERSESAFRQIVERHTEMVFAICYRKLHDVQLAEDATQLVFLGLARQAKNPKLESLEGYLARTAFYVTKAMGQTRIKRKLREQKAMESKPKFFEPPLPDPRLDSLEEVLEGLSDTLRDAIMLRYMQGMSIDAMAVALEVPQPTVRKRLVRALDRLRELMEDKGYGVTLAVAAGMLGKFTKPVPRPELAASIAANVLSAPTAPPASLSFPKPRYTPRIAVAVGSAAAIGTVAALAVLPRLVHPSPAPLPVSRTMPPAQSQTPMSFQQKLKRKVPGMIAYPIPLDFAIKNLQDASGIPMRPQWEAIEAAGIDRKKHVTATVLDATVIDELDAVLKSASPQGDLEYVISGDAGVIIIRARSAGHAQVLDPSPVASDVAPN